MNSSTLELPITNNATTGGGGVRTKPKYIRQQRTVLLGAASAVAVITLILFGRATRKCETAESVQLLDGFAAVAARGRPKTWKILDHLVLVAGHAIYIGNKWDETQLSNEDNWILEKFQHGQVPAFLAHIKRGVDIAANDSNSLLVFSGGQTRPGAGPRSEGATYWLTADTMSGANSTGAGNKWQAVKTRATTEEYARDSFENLLFSVCRFRQLTGRYPGKITVVSFEFKRLRFEVVHRGALRYPQGRFQFDGTDTDGVSVDAKQGEMKNSLGPFAKDPHGCNTEVLRGKKIARNPYLRFAPYPQGCPEISKLFSHCGTKVFEGGLPWDNWPLVDEQ